MRIMAVDSVIKSGRANDTIGITIIEKKDNEKKILANLMLEELDTDTVSRIIINIFNTYQCDKYISTSGINGFLNDRILRHSNGQIPVSTGILNISSSTTDEIINLLQKESLLSQMGLELPHWLGTETNFKKRFIDDIPYRHLLTLWTVGLANYKLEKCK
jgi:hypothetical protein